MLAVGTSEDEIVRLLSFSRIQVRTPPAVTPLAVRASGETGAATGLAALKAEYFHRNRVCLGHRRQPS